MAEGIDLVNVAKTAWEIIKDNKPSAQAQSAYCQAMPSKKKVAWEDLKGWKTLTGEWPYKAYTTLDKWFGLDPSIDLLFHVEFRFGGHTDKTPGLFLDDFRVSCKPNNVDWPWKVNVNASVHGNPYNVGSSVPIGAIQVEITLSMESWRQSKGEIWRLTASADGKIKVS
jgi:hypothetical protein